MKLRTAHKRKGKAIAKAYRRQRYLLYTKALHIAKQYQCEVVAIRDDIGHCFIRNTAMVYIRTNYKDKAGTYQTRFEIPWEVIDQRSPDKPQDNPAYMPWRDRYFDYTLRMLAQYLMRRATKIPALKATAKKLYRERGKHITKAVETGTERSNLPSAVPELRFRSTKRFRTTKRRTRTANENTTKRKSKRTRGNKERKEERKTLTVESKYEARWKTGQEIITRRGE